jgi:exopolysaccharide biosynthesis polyprenyl glycosylphosphotransferase
MLALPARFTGHGQGPETLQRQLLLGTSRVAGLLAGDLACLFLLLSALAAVGDLRVAHGALADEVIGAASRGATQRWQYALALGVGLAFAGTYARGDARRDLRRVFVGVLMGSTLALWQALWTAGLLPFLVTVAGASLALFALIALGRRVSDHLVNAVFPPKPTPHRALFVGDPSRPGVARIYRQLVERRHMIPLGWLSSNGIPRSGAVLGGLADVWTVLAAMPVDTVVLCGWLPNDDFDRVVEAATAAGCRVLAVSHYDEARGLHSRLVVHGGVSFVELAIPSLRARQLLAKRLVDVVVAGLGLIALLPLGAVLAAAIKLDSPGPVFFTQDRVGLGGRSFRFVKFRTMRDGADAEKASLAHLNHTGDPRLFKIPGDPRITSVGVWLRRWSLDELPQLWNVFRGHMSLVGPRPFFEGDLATYAEHHFTRLGAKPGITGLWQVNGRSDVMDFEEVVRLDREYIDQWSLWLDCKIMARTLPAVLRRTGAY